MCLRDTAKKPKRTYRTNELNAHKSGSIALYTFSLLNLVVAVRTPKPKEKIKNNNKSKENGIRNSKPKKRN